MNTFFAEHKINLKNLSPEPFCLKEGFKYWEEKEFKDLNFEIVKDEKYTIDTSSVRNKFIDSKAYCKSRISKPIFSKDRKRLILAVEEDCRSDKSVTIYLLKEIDGKYVYETDVNSINSLSH